ncbi:MAG TPA: glycosyltransferase, partial [Acidimicrobiales bacterium]|nr:glycosyltransferase [Acidimicrobiales bacterium]
MAFEAGSTALAKRLVGRLLPEGSRRRTAVAPILSSMAPRKGDRFDRVTYSRWIRETEREHFSDPATDLPYRPLITVVVPCFNTPNLYVKQLVTSVIRQRYDNWQLCLADGSDQDDLKRHVEKQSRRDTRIHYIAIEQNLGIAGNTNVGIKHAGGEYIAFLDHDDLLSPFALSEVVTLLNAEPSTDLVYSDEDKVSSDGKVRREPLFKPDWEPELLLGVNYITHFVVARKRLVDQVGGLREGFDGAQDYDLLLRLTEQTSNIAHIPKVLYHWRSATGSAALDIGEKGFADSAGRRALGDAIERRGASAEVIPIHDRPANYRVSYSLPRQPPKVSIIISSAGGSASVFRCAESVRKASTYPNFEIIDASAENTGEPNVAKQRNIGRQQADGEYLIFLDASTEVVAPDCIEELVAVASQPGIGAVAPLLCFPDGRVSHAGTVVGMTGIAGRPFRLRQPTEWTHFGIPAWPRNYLAVSPVCLTISASRFDEVGGFDEELGFYGSSVALGIRLHEAGYRNVHWPFAELVHHEDAAANLADHCDQDRLAEYCRPYLEHGDPYFSPNLDPMNEQVGLRT